MNISLRTVAIAGVAVFTGLIAGTARSMDTKAVAYALGMDVTSRHMVAYCRDNNAPNARVLEGLWQQWRQDNQIDSLTAGLSDDLRKALDARFADMDAAIARKMREEGNAATVCQGIASVWRSPEFDLRARYPQLQSLPPAPAARAGASQVAPRDSGDGSTYDLKNFNRDYVFPDLAPGGTYYTPAQLTALVASWRKAADVGAARRAMREHGPLFVKGRVVQQGEHYQLFSDDGVFRSRLAVSTGLNLSMFNGRTITVVGVLDELPGSMVFLRKTRLVQDASRLKPSGLDETAGLNRKAVDNRQITAADGNGLKPYQVYGVLYHGYGTTGVSGYEFREEVRLLLKDGSVYFSDDMAPDALDAGKSQKLEPQQWGKWRQAGGGFQIARNDAFGALGEYRPAPGRILPAWPRDQRLNGAYTAQSFHGSLALGGTYSSTRFVFKPDGRFERIGYSQSGSGTLAQTGSGFSASASTHSDGKGTRSVGGGGNDGSITGSSNYAYTSKKSGDGSGNRGTYRLDGLGLEMRFDDGRVERVLCAPWDDKHDKIYMFGTTYSSR